MSSIFTKSSIVSTCAAYNVVVRESFGQFNVNTRNTTKVVNLVANETLIVEGNYQIFRINSVSSVALASNECPITEWKRAVELGHKCYWISGCPTVLSSSKKETKDTHIQVDFDTIYKFEGLYWKIAEDFNNNLKLVEISLN